MVTFLKKADTPLRALHAVVHLEERDVELAAPVVREIGLDQAKQEVLAHLVDRGPAPPSEVAAALALDPLVVVDAFAALEAEGLICD